MSEVCKVCRGTGKIFIQKFEMFTTCLICNGTGKVEKTNYKEKKDNE